jgi:murein L,D-transpeptidase YafK
MKNLFGIIITLFIAGSAIGQGSSVSFVDFQRGLPRPGDALKRKGDTLQKQFMAKGLAWPAKYVYIRSFKFDGQLEVWVKNDRKEQFKLFKTYRVCALAGSLGPKRMEGDYQVPEGFYYINEFNPNSNYYLSLGINYPNPSDRILSDSLKPGGDIYIHGSCVTVGCIPVTDQQIDEIYILAAYAKNSGQDFIPVHIFPVRYNNKKSVEYLNGLARNDGQLKSFANNLENVFNHFELTRQLPVIMTNSQGEYIFEGLSRKAVGSVAVEKPKKPKVTHRVRNITATADVVTSWPQFPGGGTSFLAYLDKMGKAMATSLPSGLTKANLMIEFIIDTDGLPTNIKVLKGVNDEFDEELITVLEQMPAWQPALLNDKPVAKKMKQSFVIE